MKTSQSAEIGGHDKVSSMKSVLLRMLRIGPIRVAVLLSSLVLLAIVAVLIGNQYGSTWGGIVGIGIGPILVANLMRRLAGIPRNQRPHRGRK